MQPITEVPLDDTRTFAPGDQVLTTCFYNNPFTRNVTFGEKTNNEM